MRVNTLWLLVAGAAALSGQAPAGEPRMLTWGFEQRVRTENWNNLLDFNDSVDDQRNQIRYRTRVWMNLPVSKDIDIYAGLNQETNQIVKTRAPYRLDEIVFENLYVDFKKLFVKGLSLRAGRQNIMKGEGFLFLEGNPYDGSRSIYFNALNLAYSWKKSKLELIAIDDPYRDRFFPRIHDRSKSLIEWNERAIGLYYTDKNHTRLPFEAYYFYKKETNDPRPATNAQFQPDRHIHTAGARAVRQFTPQLSLTGEWAFQWGRQHPGVDIRGWGGYSYVKRSFDTTPLKPYLLGGWWGFSGDNPSTSTIEDWDPLFGRWPKWSELYIYTQWKEKGVAYWTNTGMWQAEAGGFWKAFDLRATYYRMSSFHPFAGNPNLFSKGTVRGDMYQGRVGVTAGKNWKGHVLYEYLAPGDFYTHHAGSYFLRFEVSFLITGKMKI